MCRTRKGTQGNLWKKGKFNLRSAVDYNIYFEGNIMR